MSRVDEILAFWFGVPGEPGYGKQRSFWFNKKPEFDQELCHCFLSVYQLAADGHLEHWQASSQGCLALILLFDQFPRNMFRGTPQAFATDSQAIATAKHAIAKGFDQELMTVQLSKE